MIGRGSRSTRRKPAPVPLCPPQIPHAARTRTRAVAVGSQRLTAWATAGPNFMWRRGYIGLKQINMKSSVFWDVTPCSQSKVNWRFERKCRLLLQGRRISQARNQRESRWQGEPPATCFHAGSLLVLFIDPEDGGDMFHRNVGWLSKY
jgi:hypothetical protein